MGAGTVGLVGEDVACVVKNVSALFLDEKAYSAMAQGVNPHGDKYACTCIVEAFTDWT